METSPVLRGTITYVMLRPSLIAALVFLSACSKTPAGSGAPALVDHEVLLELGQRADLTQDVSVQFTKVVEDSRCPANVVCVWMGNARVELQFRGLRAVAFPPESLNTNQSVGKQAVTHRYVRVELVNVEPYPGLGSGDPVRVRLHWSYLPD